MVILTSSSEVKIHDQSICRQENRNQVRHFIGRLRQGTGCKFVGRDGGAKQVGAVTGDKYSRKQPSPLAGGTKRGIVLPLPLHTDLSGSCNHPPAVLGRPPPPPLATEQAARSTSTLTVQGCLGPQTPAVTQLLLLQPQQGKK